MSKQSTIFVSIASYRDPELRPTIQDCLSKADRPQDLRFGVCWQHGSDEAMPEFGDDHRFRILDVDWRESKGACWARAEIMKLRQDEAHFLQIDSHHRFAQGWDTRLVDLAAMAPSSKPIVSTYCPMYDPAGGLLPTHPYQMNFDYFTSDGIPLFKPMLIKNVQTANSLVRARFVSGHFLFAAATFIDEVRYDPTLYFLGEEISVAVRAYTWGYDFFHPCEALIWHEYSRNFRKKHWDDHTEAAGVELAWHQRDTQSRQSIARFLRDPYLGLNGCGSVRTFAEYEAYAGINFAQRKVQNYTIRGGEPPNPCALHNWEDGVNTWIVKIQFRRCDLGAEATSNVQLLCVVLEDPSQTELHRNDISGEELRLLLAGKSEFVTIERSFQSETKPVRWTVWPMLSGLRWAKKISGEVGPISPSVNRDLDAIAPLRPTC